MLSHPEAARELVSVLPEQVQASRPLPAASASFRVAAQPTFAARKFAPGSASEKPAIVGWKMFVAPEFAFELGSALLEAQHRVVVQKFAFALALASLAAHQTFFA